MQILFLDESALYPRIDLRLLVKKDLLPETHHDQIGALDHGIVQLVAGHVAVAADDAVDESALLEPLALDDGIHRVGGGGDDVAAAHGLFRGVHRHDLHPGFLGHLFRETLAVGAGGAEHLDLVELAHGASRQELRLGLLSGPHQSHHPGVRTGQVLGCHATGGADAEDGDVVIVHDGQERAVLHVEQENEAHVVTGVDPSLGTRHLLFVGEGRVDPEAHGLHPGHQPHDVVEVVLETRLLPGRLHPDPGAGRVYRTALAHLPVSLFDSVDFVRHGDKVFQLFILEYQNH